MKTINISDVIIKPYHEVFSTNFYQDLILTSGRAGTKSSFFAIESIYEIINGFGSVVVLRKNHNKLRKTVFPETLVAIKRLGLQESDFKITVSPMKITYKGNGASVLFTGSDNPDDTKGMIDDKFPISLVGIDEVTEFFTKGEGDDELRNIKATFIRGGGSRFRMMYMFNPPKNPKAPVNEWASEMAKRPLTVLKRVDYRDVPKDWLGDNLIREAETDRQFDEKLYNWLWLGQSTGLDELIYYMFDEQKHIQEYKRGKLAHIGVGVDYGQMNATTFQAFGIDVMHKRLQGLGEYYHSGRDTGKQGSPSEYAKALNTFIQQTEDKVKQRVQFVAIDPSASGMIAEIHRQFPHIKIVKPDNSVIKGINRVQSLMTYNAVVLSPKQKELIGEMYLYEWDMKSVERGKEQPIKDNDHAQDAFRYYTMTIWKYMQKLLPRLRNLEKEE